MNRGCDKWSILKIKEHDGGYVYKLFRMWHGGYLDGDSWAVNSGITEIKKDGDFLEVKGYSGSSYRVERQREGCTAYGASLIYNWYHDDNVNVTLIDFSSPEVQSLIV